MRPAIWSANWMRTIVMIIIGTWMNFERGADDGWKELQAIIMEARIWEDIYVHQMLRIVADITFR